MARPQLETKLVCSEHSRTRLPYLISSTEGPKSREVEANRTVALQEIHTESSLPGYWRSIGLLAGLTLAAIGVAGALIHFAGILVGVIVIAAFSALVAWGNWILDNTIQL